MMRNADTPASPVKPEVIQGNHQVYFGLTKREQFAAMAMQALLTCSHPQMIEARGEAAGYAVICADRLLAALEE